MRLTSVDNVLFAITNDIPVEYRIRWTKDNQGMGPGGFPYKWSFLDWDDSLVIDCNLYDYYIDRPIALWSDKCQERYVKLQRLSDLDFERLITLDNPEVDLCFDESSYVGFLHVNERIDEREHKIYQVRMDYGSKWIGVWHLEGTVNEKD